MEKAETHPPPPHPLNTKVRFLAPLPPSAPPRLSLLFKKRQEVATQAPTPVPTPDPTATPTLSPTATPTPDPTATPSPTEGPRSGVSPTCGTSVCVATRTSEMDHPAVRLCEGHSYTVFSTDLSWNCELLLNQTLPSPLPAPLLPLSFLLPSSFPLSLSCKRVILSSDSQTSWIRMIFSYDES